MERGWRRLSLVLVLIFLVGLAAWASHPVSADTPGRQATIVVSYTEYEWWLSRWSDNEMLCRILVDHDGLPTTSEVLKACGQSTLAAWQATPPCTALLKGKNAITECAGLYLHKISSQPKKRDVIIDLPPALVWVTLEGCTPVPPENRCEKLPALLLTGEEPLPNERITAIRGTYGDQPFACEAQSCSLPLRSTPPEGVVVQFWAESSYGDKSEVFSAQVRVIDSGVAASPGAGGWYVDVLSTQWRGAPLASCSKTWEAFPPIGGMPVWLSTPEDPSLLASGDAYYYLAGRLISQKVVDASSCPAGGLLPNGYADVCGLEKARPIVERWQNQFDARIIEVARESGVPAQLMKNLFAQESQFWPGVFRVPHEFGLGQITDNGAETILLWNSSFFDQFCPLVFAEETCAGGYLRLKPGDQAILRGALALEARSDCPQCATGVDLSHAGFSVSLFANTLRANCDQVAQIIFTATKQPAGAVSSYEDLWRYTVANYHAGPGCLSYAIHLGWAGSSGKLTWSDVAENFTETCKGVIPYVDKITRYSEMLPPAPTSTPNP